MSLTRIATHGPASIATGAISVTYTGTAGAGNLLTLYVLGLGVQTYPASISGFVVRETGTTGGGFSWARYDKTAAGTETGSQAVMTATVPTIALITEWDGTTGPYGYITSGSDSSDAADGLVTAGASIQSHNGDVIEAISVFALSTPSFPTVPAGPTGRAIVQAGATLGTITNRAGSTWQTNHRYNISDIPVTTGATGVPTYSHSTTLTNLRGATLFTIISETAPAGGTTPANAAPPTATEPPSPILPGIEVSQAYLSETPTIPITGPFPVVSSAAIVPVPTATVPPTPLVPVATGSTTTPVGKALQLVWNVAAPVLTVNKTLGLQWNVRALTSAQVTLRWNVLANTPVTTYDFEIDGMDMRTEAWNVSTLTGRYGMPMTRGDDLVLPGRSGYIFTPNKPLEAGFGSLAVWMTGANPDGTVPATQTLRNAKFRENMNLLQRVFTRRHRLSIIRAGQPDGTFRVAHAQWTGWSDPTVVAGGTRAEWNIDFTIPSVFWSDEDTTSQSTSASSVLPKTMDLSLFADMTGFIEDGVYNVTGPIINPRITDAETGQYVELAGTVATGETWKVDSGAYTSEKNGASVLTNTRHSGGYRFLTLSNIYGVTGIPRLILSGTGGGATTRLGVVARRKWVTG